MTGEYEVVSYGKLHHFRVFLNRITYRNYHSHGAFELLLVLEGQGRLNLRDRTVPLKPGVLAVLNPNEPHEIEGGGGSVLAVIFQVSQNFCRDYVPSFRNLMFQEADLSRCLSPVEPLYRCCCQLICKASLCYLLEEAGFELGCVAYIADLFRKLLGSVPHQVLSGHDRSMMRKRIRRVTRITEYLDENCLGPVRLQDLADLEGLTPTYVSHLFTDYYGISFQEYLNNLRFEKAMTLMRNPRLSQAEIAAMSGFSDPKYLVKAVKNRLGCSVKACQESLKGSESLLPSSSELEYVYPPEESIQPILRYLAELESADAPAVPAGQKYPPSTK